MSNSFTLICGRKKHPGEQTTFILTFWFKRKKNMLEGSKPHLVVFFFKTKHQRLTQRVVTTRQNSWRQRQKKKQKKTHLVFSVFFGNCYVYFRVMPPPSPRKGFTQGTNWNIQYVECTFNVFPSSREKEKLEAVCEFEQKHLNHPCGRFLAGDGQFLLFRKKKQSGENKRYCKKWIRCYGPQPPTSSVIWQYWQHDRDLLEYQQRLDKTNQACRESKRVESFAKNVVLFDGVGIKIPPAQTSFIPTHSFFKKKKTFTLYRFYILYYFFHFSLYLYIICSQYLLVCGVSVGSGCECVCVYVCRNAIKMCWTLLFCAICSIVKVEGLRKKK